MRKQISTVQALALLIPATVFAAGISFDAHTDFNVGITPCTVMIGDFNSDGEADLVTANVNSNNVSILTGNSDGTFKAMVNYNAGANPHFVTKGDFNADGKADLVVANGGSNNLSILRGNGDGTFQAAVNYGVGVGPRFVATGDFNADGFLDLAAANMSSNTISVLLGNGDGTFQGAASFPVGSAPHSLATADFNADGVLDLSVANYNGNSVSILGGNGDGTFLAAVNFAVGTSPRSIVVADFNADTKPDLAVANKGGNNVSILLGNGDATFQPMNNYGVGTTPYSVNVGDLNADGVVDIAVANVMSNNVSILRGNGDGTFQVADHYGAGVNAVSVAVGDVNGDDKPDLAVSNATSNNVSVLLNAFESPAWTSSYPQTSTEDLTVAEVSVNIDRPGVAHLVCLNAGAPSPTSLQVHAGQNANGITLPETLKSSIPLFANSTATLTCTALAENKMYDLYVVAADSEGSLQLQPNKQIKMIVAPSPSWVTVPASSLTGSYRISWARTSLLTATYKVEISSDGGSSYAPLTSTTNSWYDVSGQRNGTYLYRVITSNAGYLDSEPTTSGAIPVTISCANISAINLPTSNNTGSYRLGWTGSTSTGITYVVTESINGGSYQPLASVTTNFIKFAWKANGNYRYQIQATKPGYGPSAIATSPTLVVAR